MGRLAALVPLLAVALGAVLLAGTCAAEETAASELPSFYSSGLQAVDSHGQTVPMSQFAGKVTLVVNVASLCGYTDSNYKGLNAVYDKYREFGLEVLAFPCNQFGGQEPASLPEIESFLSERYAIKFPLFQKVEVNGEDQHPIFKWLKEQTPPAEGKRGAPGADIAWNFEKFLIDKAGRPVKRYSSVFTDHEVEHDVYDQLVKEAGHEDL
ncbi:hypothetical protein ABPG77_009695 [Micractinium sp. CCAP 211/92]